MPENIFLTPESIQTLTGRKRDRLAVCCDPKTVLIRLLARQAVERHLHAKPQTPRGIAGTCTNRVLPTDKSSA